LLKTNSYERRKEAAQSQGKNPSVNACQGLEMGGPDARCELQKKPWT